MDINELKNEHPELYQSILDEGAKIERKRVTAHLKLGKSSANLDYAFKCIEEGNSIKDDDVMAEYLSSQLNKKDLDRREEDNPPDLNLNTSSEENEKTLEDAKIKKLVEKVMEKSKETVV